MWSLLGGSQDLVVWVPMKFLGERICWLVVFKAPSVSIGWCRIESTWESTFERRHVVPEVFPTNAWSLALRTRMSGLLINVFLKIFSQSLGGCINRRDEANFFYIHPYLGLKFTIHPIVVLFSSKFGFFIKISISFLFEFDFFIQKIAETSHLLMLGILLCSYLA